MKLLRQNLGELTIGLGIAHLAFGARAYRDTIADFGRDGWWMSISGDKKTERSDCFWFMVGGVSAISEGLLLRHMQSNGLRIPRAYGLINLGLMAAVGSSIPGSGAPMGLAISALLLTGGEPKAAHPGQIAGAVAIRRRRTATNPNDPSATSSVTAPQIGT